VALVGKWQVIASRRYAPQPLHYSVFGNKVLTDEQ